MGNKYFEENIKILNISNKIIEQLKNNDILYIKDLWKKNRKELKDIGLKDSDINNISIRMQLIGLDINKKIYK